MKLCEFENCKYEATYALYFMKPILCKDHKNDKMKTKTCICNCGKSRPCFGLETDKKPSCCKECKTEEMINFYSKKCKCGKSNPIYGLETDKKLICCSKCKTEEMIDLVHINCLCGKAYPVFGLETDDKPTCCIDCKTDKMIYLKKLPKCKCNKSISPSFGLENDYKPTCCSECKTPEMIDLKHKKCICGKSNSPSFGLETDNKPTCCSKCKTDEMINIKHIKCVCGKAHPIYGLINDKIPTCCKECKSTEMIDLIHKLCKSNYLEEDKKFECITQGNKKYKGFCSRCYSFHFPNDPLTFQIRSKTKEVAVRDYINTNFEGFHHDKPLWVGGCDCTHKRRIDHRKIIGNTLLCIETDENQHKRYDKEDEEIRYDDLMMIHGGKFIFIRFNPDKYKEDGKNKNPTISTRLIVLKNEIEKQIKRIENEENENLLEEIFMYYDS
jgi:hypothetical protein